VLVNQFFIYLFIIIFFFWSKNVVALMQKIDDLKPSLNYFPQRKKVPVLLSAIQIEFIRLFFGLLLSKLLFASGHEL